MSKIISLDFWGTIAVFNPQYAAARKRYLATLFNRPEEEAHARYQYVKRGCDHSAEHFGKAMTPLVAVKTMIEGMKLYPTIAGHDPHAVNILADFEQMVRDNPPLLHDEFAQLLRDMREEGFIIGVASNTNFIAGALVQSIFNLDWSFAVYSDEIGVSKPDPDFFRTVLVRARKAAGRFVGVDEIIHIGDNSVCDQRGAQRIGMKGWLTHSPDETMQMLHKLRAEERLVA